MKAICELELFEEKVLHSNNAMWESVKRVPGGWLYHNSGLTVDDKEYSHFIQRRYEKIY